MNFSFPWKPLRSSLGLSKLCAFILQNTYPPPFLRNVNPPPKCLTPESNKNALVVVAKMITSGLFCSPAASYKAIKALCTSGNFLLAARYLTQMEFENDQETYFMVGGDNGSGC
ncbi:hypothetical protein CXB51_007598 [Gossypium anomalum]|uniref:Uncharacterized protein n=1 Tax=Gossypium anomalum TaxID=47600 RepID=A0A8J5Z7U7_9ROSI|nr:hypothetical protein CXB51_007598 [Gossypium anomalum]